MKIKFVDYTGKWPNLCSGKLTLDIERRIITFGYETGCDFPKFWSSGGCCYFRPEEVVEKGDWEVDKDELPDELKEYSEQIKKILNENIPKGCCGGCL